MTDWGPAVREYEEFASEYRGSLLGTGECVRKADAAIAELKAEVNQAYDDGESSGYAEWVGEMIDAGLPDNPHAVVAAKESFYARIIELEAEIERLTDRAAYLHGHNVSLMAEVERLKCCGNCDHLDYDGYHHFYQCFPSPGEACFAVKVSDHCHFTPSRWEERRDPEVGA